MHLVRYSALTGDKEADLFTEKNEHYVEPQHPVLFLLNKSGITVYLAEPAWMVIIICICIIRRENC